MGREKPSDQDKAEAKRESAMAKVRARLKKMTPEQMEAFRQTVAEVCLEQLQKKREQIRPRPKPPKGFLRAMLLHNAGLAKINPADLVKAAGRVEEIPEIPEDLREWYPKIYGDFAKPPLCDLYYLVVLRGLDKEKAPALVEQMDQAITEGNIKWLEDLTSCVALIHEISYSGNGQARRLASATRRNIQTTYLRLFGSKGKNLRPSAMEIRVALARQAVLEASAGNEQPKFTDIWYLLRSGPDSDEDDPSRQDRYEITGIKNIKKHLKALKLKAGPPLRGPLTVKKLKFILDKWDLHYRDDSEMVT